MDKADIFYLVLLFFSIGFGFFYRKIENAYTKQNVGSLVGFLLVFLVSGWHTIHILITIAVNCFIILVLDKRQCHFRSFTFSFLYLIFFRSTTYFGIPYPPTYTNLIEMLLVLRLVGLALDVQDCCTRNGKEGDGDNTDSGELKETAGICNISVFDVFHYSFFYCGVLTGPYLRYRTYVDHLKQPFYKYDNFVNVLVNRMTYLPMFAIFYLIANYYWPLSYISDPEFEGRSFLYRYWYMWPTFFIFRMRLYTGMTLSECVCITAGLGVYPDFTSPKSCYGPTENYDKLDAIASDSDKLKETDYNYKTVYNIDPYGADFCPTMREGMKNWNLTVQYWLAMNVYKRFPSKKYRTVATMIVSAIWHGVYSGYYICMGSVPFGLMVEDIWVKLLLKDNKGMIPYLIMLFLKMQLFSYQAIAFVLLDVTKIWNYYNSVYHCMVIFYLALYILGKYLLKQKQI